MLITASKGAELAKLLEKKRIPAAIIGRITEAGRNIIRNGNISLLNPPDTDEIYKALK